MHALVLDADARHLVQTTHLSVLVTREVEYVAYVCSGLLFLHAALSLCRCGVKVINEVMHYLTRWVLALVLLLLSLLYMPVTRQLLTIFLCRKASCPAGTWYPKQVGAHSS